MTRWFTLKYTNIAQRLQHKAKFYVSLLPCSNDVSSVSQYRRELTVHSSEEGFTVRVVVTIIIKVKFSRYRPEQALGDPEVKAPDFLDFRHYEGGKVVVALTHRPSLPQ
jgi:hypothetical protein